MSYLLKALFGRKVMIALTFLVLISIFAIALNTSDATVNATGNVIKFLEGE